MFLSLRMKKGFYEAAIFFPTDYYNYSYNYLIVAITTAIHYHIMLDYIRLTFIIIHPQQVDELVHR